MVAMLLRVPSLRDDVPRLVRNGPIRNRIRFTLLSIRPSRLFGALLSSSLNHGKLLISLFFLESIRYLGFEPMVSSMAMQQFPSSLPPHLREVCDILARGLVRLRSRTADGFDRDRRTAGESSLHYPAHQSVHAVPLERNSA
jgi:hypothetical protein